MWKLLRSLFKTLGNVVRLRTLQKHHSDKTGQCDAQSRCADINQLVYALSDGETEKKQKSPMY